MISPVFELIGLWVVAMIVTFVLVCLAASSLNREWISDFDEAALVASLIVFVVLLELALSAAYVNFKSNPEKFGYTRIEQEVEMEVMDE
jgi:hypothetical protein